MFNSFKRKIPEISIFHNPSSPPSTKALGLLRSALSSPYPPIQPASQPNNPTPSPPLEYALEVIEAPPTADQIRTILSYMPSKATNPALALLSAHPSATAAEAEERPQTVQGIVALVQKNPRALKWPIVVDWKAGRAAVGDVEGVRAILEGVRRVRDGEEGEEEIVKPKGWFM